MAFVDHQVGVIWDALQTSDYADNTIVIVTSDHGYHLGEKDHLQNESMGRNDPSAVGYLYS